MKTAILGLMLIVAVAVLIFVRRAAAKSLPPSNVETDVHGHPYHCVVIRYPDKACAAVKRLSGRRLLSKEAPRLPLPECDATACHCRYVHFADRRHSDDRRDSPTTISRMGDYGGAERRAGRERRRAVPDHGDARTMRARV